MAVDIRKHNLSVVHLVPFAKGTVDAGAATGVRRRFFGGFTAVSLRRQRNGGKYNNTLCYKRNGVSLYYHLSGFSLILTLCLGYFAGVAVFFSIKTTDLPPAGIS